MVRSMTFSWEGVEFHLRWTGKGLFWTRRPSFILNGTISVHKPWTSRNKHYSPNWILTGMVKLPLVLWTCNNIHPLHANTPFHLYSLSSAKKFKHRDLLYEVEIKSISMDSEKKKLFPALISALEDQKPYGTSLTTVTACCGWCVQCKPQHFRFSPNIMYCLATLQQIA